MARPDRSLDLVPASVRDYRELARRRLPRQLFDYIDGGAYEETTMRANVDELGALKLRQRVLRDVSALDLTTTVLGQELAMPVILGPVGLAGMFAQRAEVQAAKAAAAAGIPFTESTVSIAGTQVATTFVNSMTLTATLPAKLGTKGFVNVVVTNPDTKSASSNTLRSAATPSRPCCRGMSK